MVESQLIPERSNGAPTISFLRTPSGVLLVVNFIMLMISWCILAVWRGNVHDAVADSLLNQTGFFLFSTVVPWLIYFIFFVILVLACNEQFSSINWPKTFFFNCVFWAFFLFIASCVLASKANRDPCEVWQCTRLQAASAFGFLTTFTLALQAFFYYREFSNDSYQAPAGAI